MDRENIFKQVKECVQEVLALENSEEDLIQPEASLTEDLGAESIDFVEIVHMLSGAFDVQIEREEVYPARDFFNEEAYVKDKTITEAGARELLTRWPHLNKEKVKEYDALLAYLGSISLLVDFLAYKLNV